MNEKKSGARNHHFVPQFYLKRFAKPQSNEGKLTVFDLQDGKTFQTRARNVAARRDFNRTRTENRDPNFVESWLGDIESKLNDGIRQVIEQQSISSPENAVSVLTLIARIFVAHPELRDRLTQFSTESAHRRFQDMVATPESWANLIALNRLKGLPEVSITYEEAKSIVQERRIVLGTHRESFIYDEIKAWPIIIKTLALRKWTLLISNPGIGHFATSDKPWTLHQPQSLEQTKSVDYPLATPGTCLSFPISRYLAVEGRLEEQDDTVHCTSEQITSFNRSTVLSAYRQVYSADDFSISDCDGQIRLFCKSKLWNEKIRPRAQRAHTPT